MTGEEIVEGAVSGIGISTGALAIGVAFIFMLIGLQRLYKSVNSDEAIVVTGMGASKEIEIEEANLDYVPKAERVPEGDYTESQLNPVTTKLVSYNKIIKQGGAIIYPEPFQKINRIPLGAISIELSHKDLISGNNVPVDIVATINVKVQPTTESIITAAQNFRNMDKTQIESFVKDTLDGHIRGIVAQKAPEEINKNLEDTSREVTRVSAPDMEKLGLSIINFVINKVGNEEYFKNLAKPREAAVARDALIAEAMADKEARLKQAEAEQLAVQREQKKAEEIAKYERDAQVKTELMRVDIEKQKAEADLANQLKSAEVNEQVIEKEQAVEIMRNEKEKEVQLKKAEAEGTYMKELAEFQKKKTIIDAEAMAEKQIKEAEGEWEAKKIEEHKIGEGQRLKDEERAKGIEAIGIAEGKAAKERGLGEAESIKAKKNADAEGTKNMMKAYGEMNDKALQIQAITKVTEVMPEIAKESAQGVGKMGEKMTYLEMGSGDGGGAAGKASEQIVSTAAGVSAILKSHGLDLNKFLSGNVNVGDVDIDKMKKVIAQAEKDKTEEQIKTGRAI